MTAQKYLQQLKNMDVMIDQNIERLEAMRSNASGMGAMDYSKDKVQTSPADRLCSDVCDIVQFNEQINEQVDRFVDLGRIINQQIQGMPDELQREVLLQIYVNYKTVRETAAIIGRSLSRTFVIRRKALKNFEKQYLVL